MQETRVRSLGQEDPLEKEMATHSSTLAWKIPWTEKPCRLNSPWGHKESDTTEWLHFYFFLCNYKLPCGNLCFPQICVCHNMTLMYTSFTMYGCINIMQIIIHKYITFYINNYLKHKFLEKELQDKDVCFLKCEYCLPKRWCHFTPLQMEKLCLGFLTFCLIVQIITHLIWKWASYMKGKVEGSRPLPTPHQSGQSCVSLRCVFPMLPLSPPIFPALSSDRGWQDY